MAVTCGGGACATTFSLGLGRLGCRCLSCTPLAWGRCLDTLEGDPRIGAQVEELTARGEVHLRLGDMREGIEVLQLLRGLALEGRYECPEVPKVYDVSVGYELTSHLGSVVDDGFDLLLGEGRTSRETSAEVTESDAPTTSGDRLKSFVSLRCVLRVTRVDEVSLAEVITDGLRSL